MKKEAKKAMPVKKTIIEKKDGSIESYGEYNDTLIGGLNLSIRNAKLAGRGEEVDRCEAIIRRLKAGRKKIDE